MSHGQRFAVAIAATALLLGILGDALLTPAPWGLGAALWAATIVASVLSLAAWGRRGGPRAFLPVGLALPFAFGLVWRDSVVLKTLDVFAILTALALPFLARAAESLRRGTLVHAVRAALTAVALTLTDSLPLLFDDIQWGTARQGGWTRHAAAAGRGVLIAAPMLTLFGGLLVAADAAFATLMGNWASVLSEDMTRHLAVSMLGAWAAGGYLRGTLQREQVLEPGIARPTGFSLGITEVGTVLGLVNTLFLAFVVVQFRYFFGGEERVLASTTLTYAEYARRGFFELATVSALVLPALLGLHWLLRVERPAHERLFRALAGIQLILLAVIMASALQRMRLYQREYGLTELRVYTTAFMAWLGVVFLWFAATVLRGQRERFFFGALVAGFIAAAALHVLNPDGLIARVNTDRAVAGHRFDAAYTSGLSADAVPALMDALPSLAPADRCIIANALLARWSRPDDVDWRTFSFARDRAVEQVEANRQRLQDWSCESGRTP